MTDARRMQSTFASGLGLISGMTVSSAGDVFEADAGSGNIYEFTPGGAQSTLASGLFTLPPAGMAVDSAGNLFVLTTLGITKITSGVERKAPLPLG